LVEVWCLVVVELLSVDYCVFVVMSGVVVVGFVVMVLVMDVDGDLIIDVEFVVLLIDLEYEYEGYGSRLFNVCVDILCERGIMILCAWVFEVDIDW